MGSIDATPNTGVLGDSGGGMFSLAERSTGVNNATGWSNFTGVTCSNGNHFLLSTAGQKSAQITTNTFVIEVVAQLTDPVSNSNNLIYHTSTTAGNKDFWIAFFRSGEKIELYLNPLEGGSIDAFWSISVYNDGNPHLLQFVVDLAANAELFLDNVSQGTVNVSALNGRTFSCANISIGGYQGGGSFDFLGTVYEVAVMAPSTTRSTRNIPPTTPAPDYLSNSTSGMIAHWKMLETSGDITDSKNLLVVPVTGSPTYRVQGPA